MMARRTTLLYSPTLSATIVVVSAGSKPTEPPRQPRLEHVRDLWQMHRWQKPEAILTAAFFRRTLRQSFSRQPAS